MKTLPLQLVTLELENGQRGVFVGWPLVTKENVGPGAQIEEIWFSTVRDVPDNLTVGQMAQLVQAQLSQDDTSMH